MNLLTHERAAQPMAPDLYEVLGANRRDDVDTLRLKYRRLSRLYHPDTSFQSAAGEKFKKINAAYEVLSNPAKRALYDEFGQIPPSDVEVAKEADALLMKLIGGLFDQLKGCDDTAFDTVDPVNAMKNQSEIEQDNMKTLLEVERGLCRKLNKMSARLSRKSGDNVIAILTQHKIAQSKAVQLQMSLGLLVWQRVIEMLNSYDYELPKPKVQVRTNARGPFMYASPDYSPLDHLFDEFLKR